MKRSNVPHPDQLLLTIPQVATLLGSPESTTYALAKAGIIRTVLVGARLRVTRQALNEYVAGLEAEAAEEDRRIRRIARKSA